MIVKNVTKLTPEETKKLFMNNYKGEYSSKIGFAVILFIIALSILIYGFFDSNTLYLIFGFAFLSLSLAYFGAIIYDKIKAPKRAAKENGDAIENGITINYTFKEQSFEYNMFDGKKNKKNKYNVKEIKYVYSYPNNYFIYVGDGTTFIIGKNGFESKKTEEIFCNNLKKAKIKIRIKK